MNVRLLDNLGITVRLADLPSWPEYERARGDFFGRGRLRRLWMRTGCRILRPRRYGRLRERYHDAQKVVQQELVNKVLEEAQGG